MHDKQIFYHRSLALGSLSPPQNPGKPWIYSLTPASQETKSIGLRHQFQPVPMHFLQAQAQLPFSPRIPVLSTCLSVLHSLCHQHFLFSPKCSLRCLHPALTTYLLPETFAEKLTHPAAWVCTWVWTPVYSRRSKLILPTTQYLELSAVNAWSAVGGLFLGQLSGLEMVSCKVLRFSSALLASSCGALFILG